MTKFVVEQPPTRRRRVIWRWLLWAVAIACWAVAVYCATKWWWVPAAVFAIHGAGFWVAGMTAAAIAETERSLEELRELRDR